MWIFYAPIIVGGIALTVAGVAPVGIPLALIGAGTLVYSVKANTREPNEPKSVAGGHKAPGYAHEGQEHMVPGQQPPSNV